MKVTTLISRLFVGLLFIFSGLIKANDPLGFSYKLTEYFEVFDMHFLIPLSLPLAVIICISEVLLGFTLLLASRIKLTLWLLLTMIIFFTFLTFYSAYYQKVLSCGCFGDAIPLTPWQSFSKDLILLVFILLLFVGRKHLHPVLPHSLENIVLAFVIIASTAFPIYTYNYLPVKDFRPYAIGKNIPSQTQGVPDELKFFYILKDKHTGEQIEVDKWPEDWDKKYEYVDSRTEVIKKGMEPKIKDFSIMDLNGLDYTQEIIANPEYHFLLICYDLDKTNKKSFEEINDFSALCRQDNISFVALTASMRSTIDDFKTETNTNIAFYNCDGTVLKTMIRSNPGLILLKEGTVIDKWHHNSLPSYSTFKNNYLNH